MTEVRVHWCIWTPLWVIAGVLLLMSWRIGQLDKPTEFLPPPATDAHRTVQETCIQCHVKEEIIR